MKKQSFKFFILRAFAHQLQDLEEFVLSRIDEDEYVAHETPESSARAATSSTTDAPLRTPTPSTPTNVSKSAAISRDADIASTSWLKVDQPPAHWLERVQQGAPELLKPGDSSQQQATSSPRTSPAQPVATHTQHAEVLPSGNTNAMSEAPAQSSERNKQHDQANGVASFELVSNKADSQLGNKWIHVDRPMNIHLQPEKLMETGNRPERVEHQGSANQGEASDQYSAEKPNRRHEFSVSSELRFPITPPLTSLETYPAMRWPSLPDEEIADQRDWEMMRRSWERQQRLNEEQRGISWNA